MNAHTQQFYECLYEYRNHCKQNIVDTPEWLNSYLDAVMASIERDEIPNMEMVRKIEEHLSTPVQCTIVTSLLGGFFYELFLGVIRDYRNNHHIE
jgi:hypothetical protein